jgi:hypothetical protein
MLAHETKSPVLGEEEVGVVIQVHLKTQPQKVTDPKMIHLKKRAEICIKANSSKKKPKMELFLMDSIPNLHTKNLGNFPIFLTITHITPSAKRFRGYNILKFDFAVEFCFWTEERLSGTQLSGLRLTETPELPNTITVGNSLSFPSVHHTAPIGNLTGLLKQKSGQSIPLGISQGFSKIWP